MALNFSEFSCQQRESCFYDPQKLGSVERIPEREGYGLHFMTLVKDLLTVYEPGKHAKKGKGKN